MQVVNAPNVLVAHPEFGAFLRDDIAKWGKVVREAKMQPE